MGIIVVRFREMIREFDECGAVCAQIRNKGCTSERILFGELMEGLEGLKSKS